MLLAILPSDAVIAGEGGEVGSRFWRRKLKLFFTGFFAI